MGGLRKRMKVTFIVYLIGALALAFMPWHIHASGYFKPDAQLVAMVLLAFYLFLEALDSPSWRSYLLAGVGIGGMLAALGAIIYILIAVKSVFFGVAICWVGVYRGLQVEGGAD